MAVLTAEDRKKLPAKKFAGPDRSFPVNDKIHARLAKSAVARKENSGTMSKSLGDHIDAVADGVLKKHGMKK